MQNNNVLKHKYVDTRSIKGKITITLKLKEAIPTHDMIFIYSESV
jgi:hypothetical protein